MHFASLSLLAILFQSPANLANPNLRPGLNQALSLEAFTVQSLDLVFDPPSGLLYTELEIASGVTWTLELSKISLRSDDFQVLIDNGRGLEPFPTPAITTWRGTVLEEPEARVRGSVVGNHLSAIVFTSQETWAVQPLPTSPASVRGVEHVVYSSEHIRATDGVCGVSDNDLFPVPSSPVPFGTGLALVEIGLDADNRFFLLNDSSVTATVGDMESILNMVEGVYELSPLKIVYEITTVVVRTDPQEPYDTVEPEELLDQFSEVWNSSPESSIKRDLAHLFTGKNLTGPTIGIAELPGVCVAFGHYGLSQSRFTSNLISRTGLTAHEIGHNWSAFHCDGDDPCRIMCSGLGGCDGLNPLTFSPQPVLQIGSWRDQVSCDLSLALPQILPFREEWVGPFVNPDRWIHIDGLGVNNGGVNTPSPPYSLNLDSSGPQEFQDDEIRSNFIRLAGVNDPVFAYQTQHRGVEAGEELVVEVLDNVLEWVEINRVTSNGVDQNIFDFFTHSLPPFTQHDQFRFRFRTEGDEPDDEWYIDDISITDGAPALIPEILSVDPVGGATAGGTIVRVSGANFTADATVLVDSEPAAVTFLGGGALEVATPPHESGTVDILVSQLGGMDLLADAFTYIQSTLRVENTSALSGATAHPIAILGDQELALDAYGFGVAFDGDLLTVTDVTDIGTDAAGAAFFAPNTTQPNFWTLGVVIDLTGPGSIPAGDNLVLAIARYDVSPTASGESPLTLENGIGDPPLALSVVLEGIEIAPETTDGVLTILDALFIRGDADANGEFNGLVDALFLLDHQFLGGAAPLCLESADVDNSGAFNGLVDALYALDHQFRGGPAPAPPYPTCGAEDAAESLGCVAHPGCE